MAKTVKDLLKSLKTPALVNTTDRFIIMELLIAEYSDVYMTHSDIGKILMHLDPEWPQEQGVNVLHKITKISKPNCVELTNKYIRRIKKLS